MTDSASTTRGRPPRLARADIVRTAAEMLDRDGLDALSMRRLAKALDVATMTLYSSFANKEALLDAVVEDLLARRPAPVVAGDWRARLRAIMRHVHDELRAHPWVVAVWLRRPMVSLGPLEIIETCLCALREAGLDREAAPLAFRALVTFTFGAAAFGGREPGDHRAAVAGALAALPAEGFPELTGGFDAVLAALDPDRVFEAGLERILDGIAGTN